MSTRGGWNMRMWGSTNQSFARGCRSSQDSSALAAQLAAACPVRTVNAPKRRGRETVSNATSSRPVTKQNTRGRDTPMCWRAMIKCSSKVSKPSFMSKIGRRRQGRLAFTILLKSITNSARLSAAHTKKWFDHNKIYHPIDSNPLRLVNSWMRAAATKPHRMWHAGPVDQPGTIAALATRKPRVQIPPGPLFLNF